MKIRDRERAASYCGATALQNAPLRSIANGAGALAPAISGKVLGTTMKTIVLLIHDDEGQDARLEAGLGIARALNAHLACIDVASSTAIAAEIYVGFGETSLIARAPDVAAHSREPVRDRLAREDVAWSWTETEGDIATCIIAAARLADLVILNRALEGHGIPDMRAIIARLLEHRCPPIMAVPASLERFEFDRALVAWDGRRSAAAALRASVPLLALANRIELFTAGQVAGDMTATEAAAYLARYGIKAETKLAGLDGARVEARIAAECESWRADYVVMGGFGRGAWREAFGGVTRSLLDRSRVPLILCH